MKQSQEKITLRLPTISRQNFLFAYAGLRPFRKTGIRLEKQVRDNKVIYHNYGHGGAGISLCPSTAQQIVQLVSSNNKNCQNIAVLGSGIVGLTTAIALSKNGYSIKIYSKLFPKSQERQNQKLITSEVPPAAWSPSVYKFQDQQKHNQRSKKSYQIYKDWTKKYKGIQNCSYYSTQSQENIKKKYPQFIYKGLKKVQVKFSQKSNKQKEMIKFQNLKIDVRIFLQQLIKQCQNRNIIFTQYNFQTQKDLKNLKENHIVNCLGYGSKKLFEDNDMYGLKGHLLQFSNLLNIKEFIFLKHQQIDFYCFTDRVLVGISNQISQDNKLQKKTIQNIYNNVIRFKKQFQENQINLKSKL